MLMVRAKGKRQLPPGLPFRYYIPMAPKSIKVMPKKRGRPATGKDPVTSLRLPAGLRRSIDVWRGKQGDAPSRSEAIRRLVEQALSQEPKRKR